MRNLTTRLQRLEARRQEEDRKAAEVRARLIDALQRVLARAEDAKTRPESSWTARDRFAMAERAWFDALLAVPPERAQEMWRERFPVRADNAS